MKGKYLFTSFIMISLIMIVSASCGSSKTDKTSQETPVNYTGENINQLLTYTVPDGYHIDTENCTDKNEASYTMTTSKNFRIPDGGIFTIVSDNGFLTEQSTSFHPEDRRRERYRGLCIF